MVGEFTEESQLMMKIEREKVRARTDPWKVNIIHRSQTPISDFTRLW